MFKYLIGRVATAIPTVLAVLFITFTLTYISPFDPVRLLLQESPVQSLDTEENIARIRKAYGLDQPFAIQFGNFIGRLLQGDLGISINGQRDVARMITKTLPISAQLGLAAAALLGLVGIPLGALAALKQNTWVDYTIVGGSLVFRSVPIFVLAPLALVLFVLILKIMTVPRGWHGLVSSKTFLPILLLMLGPLPIVIRQTRAAVLEIFSQDYVRTAKAKGLRMQIIILRHILRNALIPVVTSLGFITEGLIVGAVFLDGIFAIPGFGSISEAAYRGFDYPVIMGITLVASLMVILTNLLIDLVYPFLDPRIKYD